MSCRRSQRQVRSVPVLAFTWVELLVVGAILGVLAGIILPAVATVCWWSDLPYEPVHGLVREQLFLDWHVEAVRW